MSTDPLAWLILLEAGYQTRCQHTNGLLCLYHLNRSRWLSVVTAGAW